MEREREPMMPNEDEGPREGEGIDEVPGMPNEELEQAHHDDAAREAEEEHKEE